MNLSWVEGEVRPLVGKGWGSWYTGKDEREAAFAWKKFWPQKALGVEGQNGPLVVKRPGFKPQLCSSVAG